MGNQWLLKLRSSRETGDGGQMLKASRQQKHIILVQYKKYQHD